MSSPWNMPTGTEGSSCSTDVSHALTLRGSQQCWAILRGAKIIENRRWRVPCGWYALHVGARECSRELQAWMKATIPEIPRESSLPHSAIVGVFRVSEHRRPQDCSESSTEHPCIWAKGPVCNVISHVCPLSEPIHEPSGKLGWPLSEGVRNQLRKQLMGAVAHPNDLSSLPPLVVPGGRRKRNKRKATGLPTSSNVSDGNTQQVCINVDSSGSENADCPQSCRDEQPNQNAATPVKFARQLTMDKFLRRKNIHELVHLTGPRAYSPLEN